MKMIDELLHTNISIKICQVQIKYILSHETFPTTLLPSGLCRFDIPIKLPVSKWCHVKYVLPCSAHCGFSWISRDALTLCRFSDDKNGAFYFCFIHDSQHILRYMVSTKVTLLDWLLTKLLSFGKISLDYLLIQVIMLEACLKHLQCPRQLLGTIKHIA